MDENEKPRDEGAEEDTNHESAHEDQETATDEDQHSEDEECDEAIGQLLTTIAALESRVEQLESELARIGEHRTEHEREYEHTRRPEERAADGDVSPDERHWYFRKFGRG